MVLDVVLGLLAGQSWTCWLTPQYCLSTSTARSLKNSWRKRRPHGPGNVDTPKSALPVDLVHLLGTEVGGFDEAEVKMMSKEAAVARVQRYWIDGD
ncbi:hypothetical protein [Salinactinospora qingdaonensis]|uniref:Uncharacterized protein n=1 Tax=Salinactinospora qingdaonensis TaxID=702744 RepID=A0ABP7ESG2_9ACTN